MLPIGQIHPQKNLPKINVNISIIIENIMPGKIILSLIEVTIDTRGSILKRISGSKMPFKEYVPDQRI